MDEISKLSMSPVDSLVEFYSEGLRGDHLRGFHIPDVPDRVNFAFDMGHGLALKDLIRNKHIAPERAIELINGKSSLEAQEFVLNFDAGQPQNRI